MADWAAAVARLAAWRASLGPGYVPLAQAWEHRIRGRLDGTGDLFTETIADEHRAYWRFWEENR